jgi:hypothetical protein
MNLRRAMFRRKTQFVGRSEISRELAGARILKDYLGLSVFSVPMQ